MISSVIALNPQRLLQLHEQGFSSRWIARRLGVSPGAIDLRLQQIADELAQQQREAEAAEYRPPGYDPANLRRCRSCGSLVYLWPCLACCLSESNSPDVTHPHS
ncbi:hypothetical protein ETAA8_70440 [Anatilimnocola aggregata]|uniref:Uncharacterized protein n=1 Tax=Anatilimnocola aggregata TaxID=2528021 RepID=A0A517YNS6_9BACT|nr:hypothetical protein [Anatilimnocola aggregata]QDU31882.1 hypothetical protein ETAA8_70440 [Anatilimnocola aggregata]